jgi:hypothetical protein
VGNHHRSLCPKRNSEKNSENVLTIEEAPESKDPRVSTVNEKKKSDLEEGQTSTAVGAKVCLVAGEEVLLQTATIQVKSLDSEAKTSAKILLDSASHRTYISESLFKRLHLKVKAKETLQVYTFGSEEPKVLATPSVELVMILADGNEMKITANVVPYVSGQMLPSNREKELKGKISDSDLSPTEEAMDRREIELLVGNDYFWELMTMNRKMLKPGLYWIETRLGWIITGRLPALSCKEFPSLTLLTYSQSNSVMNYSFSSMDSSLKVPLDLQEWWKLETIWIQ